MKKKTSEKHDDDISDDEDKEFQGVDELFEKKVLKEPKAGEKRGANETQNPPATKKTRGGAANPATPADPNAVKILTKNPPSEKEVEKQIREFLTVQGKVPLNRVLQKFKDVISVITTATFKEILKRLVEAKQENNVTFLYLKDDQYREFR